MSNLYYILNVGCDDETHGLVRIPDENFPKFKTFIENLNRNSYYGCMPTIEVYKIPEYAITKINNKDDVSDYDRLYMDDEVYALKDEYRYGMERVI